MKKLFFASAICFTAVAARAQQVHQFTAAFMGSVDMKAAEDKYNAQVVNLEMPNPDASAEKKRLRQLKEASAKLYPYRRAAMPQKKATAVPQPVVTIGFVADSFPGIPPDNDMAISKQNKAVSVINSNIAVLDGQNGSMAYRKNLKAYSLVVGLNSITNDYRYDPKIIYDPAADKYISIMLNGTNQFNYIVVGFSQTNDPAGRWNFYKFQGNYKNDSTWFDYPAIAITKDEFFFTGNKIKYSSSWQTGFTETVIYQLKKQDGYDSSANLGYQVWDGITYDGKPIRNLFPVKSGWNMNGPEQYFLSNRNFDAQNDTIFLVKVPDVISSGNKNLSITVLKSPVSYGVPLDGRQPDTSVTLATNDGRILGAYAIDDEIQFVSTSINTPTGASGIFHGRIANYKSSPTISHAQIFSVDTLDFGYPNITFCGNPWGLNQSIISFNYTGPNAYPGLGAITFDGAQYSDLLQVKTGDSSIKVLAGKQQRWGDYSGAQPDWNAYGAVWIEGIFGRRDKNYGNWMARLNSPLLDVKNMKVEQSASVLYPNPAMEYIQFDFETDEQQVISFAIYNSAGALVDKVLQQRCKYGQNRIRFNIGSLPPGNYYLKATQENGESIMTRSFVKQ